MPRQASIEPSGSSTSATSILPSGLFIASLLGPLLRGGPEPARAAGPRPVPAARLVRHQRLAASRRVRHHLERRPAESPTIHKPKATLSCQAAGPWSPAATSSTAADPLRRAR